MDFATLLPPTTFDSIPTWLAMDAPKFDAGGFVVGDAVTTATILCKSPGTMAGVPFVNAIFAHLGCTVEWLREEGATITEEESSNKLPVARVTGKTRCLLLGERTALNCMARASGIATQAKRVVGLVRAQGWQGQVAGTRKTTPGFGMVEKYALLVGGASTHRMDLSHMTMLKDNHIWASGSITAAVERARRALGFSSKIEVECRDLNEAFEAAKAGCDIVMLDNFSPEEIKRDSVLFKEQYPHVVVEASGGIREHTICDFICPTVDVISQGALTQGYSTVDFSMKLPRPEGMASHRNTGGGGEVSKNEQ
jgi:nicotinate-nucleotide pyrophosphorylase (carboxylating)